MRDSEFVMNPKVGVFKNIEEFKATAGGLCAYFDKKSKKELDGVYPKRYHKKEQSIWIIG